MLPLPNRGPSNQSKVASEWVLDIPQHTLNFTYWPVPLLNMLVVKRNRFWSQNIAEDTEAAKFRVPTLGPCKHALHCTNFCVFGALFGDSAKRLWPRFPHSGPHTHTVHTHIHIFVDGYTYKYINTYIYICMYVCMYVYTRIHIRTHTCTIKLYAVSIFCVNLY